MRDIIHLQCGNCKRKNYTTTKNKKTQQGKLQVKKYCPFCRSHQVHKEVK